MTDNGMVPPVDTDPVVEATTIVITFDEGGNMRLQATPDVTIQNFVLAAWLCTSSANDVSAKLTVQREAAARIQVPRRGFDRKGPHVVES